MVKNPPANAGGIKDVGLIPGLGRSLGGGNGTHSSILAWRIPWTQEPGGLQAVGLLRVGLSMTEHARTHILVVQNFTICL